jgi:putative ABC transport system permease protein
VNTGWTSSGVVTLFDQLRLEFRLALRRLWGTPVFAAFAVGSLALGLGVTTAVYATVATLLWPRSVIADPEDLAVVTGQASGTGERWRDVISMEDFELLRSRVRSVPGLGASSPVASTLNDGARTSTFVAQAVTGNYFAIVRLPLHVGRGIQESDDRPDAASVVVLSHRFWQSKAGADPGIVGRTVQIGGRPFVVIGVVAATVQHARDIYGQFGVVNGDGWVPFKDRPIVTGATKPRNEPDLTVIARMPARMPLQAFATEVAGIGAALDQSVPTGDSTTGVAPVARSWSATTAAAIARHQDAASVRVGRAVVLLVGLVLVVACTNIANLTLARSASRVPEFAVRRSLGAPFGRLVREQCAESVVVAALGGCGAILVAKALLLYFTADIPLTNFQVITLQPDLSAPAVIAAGASLLASLVVFGIVPAVQLTRGSLHAPLAAGGAGASLSRWKGRQGLIAWHVMISTVLMLVAFGSNQAVSAATRHDPGFDLGHLAMAVVDFRSIARNEARSQRAIEALELAAAAHPGFEATAIATALPIGTGVRVRQVARVSPVTEPPVWQPVVSVPTTPGIFRTLRVPIVRGRGFDDGDRARASPVIVTSEKVARQVFGTADVTNREMLYVGAFDRAPVRAEVIGVAGDTDTLALFDRRFGAVYVPFVQQGTQTRVIIIGRTAGDPASILPKFASIARQADPDLAIEFASAGAKAMVPSFVVLRAAATTSGGLSFLALTLAMLGLYGVLSHGVVRRTREVGLRLALGARASHVRRMIVMEGLRPVIWGLGLGLLAGMGVRLLVRALEIGRDISLSSPLAFAGTALILIASGFLACYLPARRASSVEPTVALRDL